MATTVSAAVAGGQFLTFEIDGEQYAVDVARSQTVLEHRKLTRIPRMPDYVRGVIDFRGSALPVIDLRRKLGLPEMEPDTAFMIVVLEIPFGGEHLTLGVTADTVKEVLRIETEAIEEAPSIGTGIDTAFIDGIGKRDDRFVIILNPQRLFRDDELAACVSSGAMQAFENNE